MQEARRRGVHRAAATYLVISWLVLEVGHVITLILELPHWVARALLFMLVGGFPIVLALTWRFRFTSEGWFPHLPESEPAAAHEAAIQGNSSHRSGHGGHGHASGDSFDPLPIIVGVLAAVALLLWAFMPSNSDHAPAAGNAHVAEASSDRSAAQGDGHEAVATSSPLRPAPRNSIAVLPFDNLSGDRDQVFFSDGMAEEVRGVLAAVEGLQVAARTSSNAFRDAGEDAATIGARLGVAYILEGSVRRSGDVVRVSTQLVEAKSGFERWSQTYDREVKDVFKVQSDIAGSVADALRIKLLPGDAARAAAASTQSPAAHDALLRATQLLNLSGDEASYRAAITQLDAAIRADPAYAPAHAARARALTAVAGLFDDAARARTEIEQAVASAQLAVRLAPQLPAAQAALAYTLERGVVDVKGAAGAYERAYRAGGSGDADLLVAYGLFNVRAGDPAKGKAALQRALTLDPVNPRAWRSLATAYYMARDTPAALRHFHEALRLSPGLSLGHSFIGDALLASGQVAAAKREYAVEKVDWARWTGLALVADRAGDRATANALLAKLRADPTLAYQVAQVLAGRGDADGAITALNRALAMRDPGLIQMRGDPLLDRVRRDPRFGVILRRVTG